MHALTLLIIPAIGLLIATLIVVAWTVHRLTHPPRRTFASAVATGRPSDPSRLAPGPGGEPRAYSSWEFGDPATPSRLLPVWDMAGDRPDGPLVVLSHGWGDSRIGALSRAGALLPMASRIVMWDMPGHGDAPGTCTLGTREVDLLLALLARLDAGSPVVLFGWSLGAGVSIAAGARLAEAPIAGVRLVGVIAEAPYRHARTPARNVLIGFAMPHRLNLPIALACIGLDAGVGARWEGFDRAPMAARLRSPLLVIHGTNDDVSPIADGRAIAAAARQGTICELSEAGHHGIWTTPLHATRATDAAEAWLRTLSTGGGALPAP